MTKSNTTSNTTRPKHNLIRISDHMTKSTAVMAPTSKPYALQVLDEQTLPTKRLKALKPRLRELWAMLEYCRPAFSNTEEAFIAQYIDSLPNMRKDAFGNRYCIVGKDAPTIAWSSHTDTVHCEEGKQAIELDKDGHFALDWHSDASCLGADCTAGVWLMRRLIMAGKPGLYIFHRDEESGGRGSKWITKNTPELVQGIKAMIALDRRGYESVITEQSTGRTASNRFATSLAAQLGGDFRPDDSGIFTDSAFYNHLIPECTNLSVGYYGAHSRYETQDPVFIDGLLINLLWLKYDELDIARDPKDVDEDARGWNGYYRNGPYGYASGAWGDYEEDAHAAYEKEQWNAAGSTYSPWDANSDHQLVDLIRRNPEAVAHLLRQWDITEDDIYEAMDDYAQELEAGLRKGL